MARTTTATALFGAVVALSCAVSRPADATELQVASGPGAGSSSWRGDGALSQSLKLGLRFAKLVSIDALGRLGYASVDKRMLTYVSLGGALHGRLGIARPYARLALVHQHEEPVSVVRHDPGGALLGVGDGIRHRGGFGSSLGVDFVVAKSGRADFLLGLDANGTWFPDPRGPAFYYGGGLWAGVDYGL